MEEGAEMPMIRIIKYDKGRGTINGVFMTDIRLGKAPM